MNFKLTAIAVIACLPLAALGAATNTAEAVKAAVALDVATNPGPGTLRLKITSRTGTTVILEKAALIEQSFEKPGAIPDRADAIAASAVRLKLPDGGTVTIPWDDIEKITVGEREALEKNYPIEITVKDGGPPKVGSSYGYNNTVVGQSEAGEFTIQLNDVKEIVVLPPSLGAAI
jgi:hypothetical protein